MALVLNNRLNPSTIALNLIARKVLRKDPTTNTLFRLLLPEILDVEELQDGTVTMLSPNRQWKPSSDFISRTMQISFPFDRIWATDEGVKRRMAQIGRRKSSRAPNAGSCWGSCVCEHTGDELKQALRDMDVPGRSKLTTKAQMCAALQELGYFGVDITYPFAPWAFLPYSEQSLLAEILALLDEETVAEPEKAAQAPVALPVNKDAKPVPTAPNLEEILSNMEKISTDIENTPGDAEKYTGRMMELNERLNRVLTTGASRGGENFTVTPEQKTRFNAVSERFNAIKDKNLNDPTIVNLTERFAQMATPQKLPAFGRRRRRRSRF